MTPYQEGDRVMLTLRLRATVSHEMSGGGVVVMVDGEHGRRIAAPSQLEPLPPEEDTP